MKTLMSLCLIAFLLPQTGLGKEHNISFTGRLASYTPTTVTIITKSGGKVRVPRKSVFPDPSGVIVGKGQVVATVPEKTVLKLNPVLAKLAAKLAQSTSTKPQPKKSQ